MKNSLKDKWNVIELYSMLVQEETWLKNHGTQSVYLVNNHEAEKKYKKSLKKTLSKNH